ncbi:hypothetical protein PALB_22410 [Pseudoalteromonas luteoviolacea B = ATCC 29581]|nr:hypothetical protein PALB_22410 [Pseudoalteromonas luteoviolacea B = ATCC 29581]
MTFKVVYIDDEVELTKLLGEFLDGMPIEYFAFNDELSGIAFCHREHPDLILIDYRLKQMTGEQVARKIGGVAPKYLVSGELELPEFSDFQRVLTKPFKFREIKTIIACAMMDHKVKK